MRVTLYDVSDDGTRAKRCTAVLSECFPDDPDGMAEAREALYETGTHRCGGGAAPTVDIEADGPIPYKRYEITRERRSVPPADDDWSFVHCDYDGAPDANDNRAGYGPSLAACRAEIDEIEDN